MRLGEHCTICMSLASWVDLELLKLAGGLGRRSCTFTITSCEGSAQPQESFITTLTPRGFCQQGFWLQFPCEKYKRSHRFEKMVHPKKKVKFSFTQPHVILNWYDFLSSMEHKRQGEFLNTMIALFNINNMKSSYKMVVIHLKFYFSNIYILL